MSKIDLGWGHSPAVRQAFLDTYHGKPIDIRYQDLIHFDYPPHEGHPAILELTRKVIKRQIGQEYDYVVLTNGATGAIDIALRAFEQRGYKNVITRTPPYYTRYPGVIAAAKMNHVHPSEKAHEKAVILMDIPSNPSGEITTFQNDLVTPVIFDAVYFNGVYSYNKLPVPTHDVLIGSYSKLLGVNGLRVGWVATNSPYLYQKIKELVTVEYCGLSKADSIILASVLKNFEWPKFEKRGRAYLDQNRNVWAQLEKYFENPIPEIGMFHYTGIDPAMQKLLNKTGISYTKGSVLGTNDNFGRFNLGSDTSVLMEAVKRILKEDHI